MYMKEFRLSAFLVLITGLVGFLPYAYWSWLYAIERVDWHDNAWMVELSILSKRFFVSMRAGESILTGRFIGVLMEAPSIIAAHLGATPLTTICIYSISVTLFHVVLFIITWLSLKRKALALLIPAIYGCQWDFFYFAMSEAPMTESLLILVLLLLWEGIWDRTNSKVIISVLLTLVGFNAFHPQLSQAYIGGCGIMALYFALNRDWKRVYPILVASIIVALATVAKFIFLPTQHEIQKIQSGLQFIRLMRCPNQNETLKGFLYYYAPRKLSHRYGCI